MALKRELKQLVFNQGIDTKTDPHLLPAGKLHQLFNARQSKIGSFAKKAGSEQIPNTVISATALSLTNPKKLLGHNDNPLVIAQSVNTGTGAVSSTDIIANFESDTNQWSNKGACSSAFTSSKPFIFGDMQMTYALPYFFETGKAGHFLCVGYVSGSQCYFNVVDPATGSVIFRYTTGCLANSAVRIITFLSYTYFVFQDAASNIYAYKYDVATAPGTFTSLQLVLANAFNGIGAYFDCCVDERNNIFYIAYKSTTPNLTIKSYSTLTSGTPAVALTPVNTATIADALLNGTPIAICANGVSQRVMVLWNIAGNSRIATFTLALGAVVAAANFTTVCHSFFMINDPDAVTGYIHVIYTDGIGDTFVSTFNFTGASIAFNLIGRACNIASRGVYPNLTGYSDRCYMYVQSVSANQQATFLVSFKFFPTGATIAFAILSRSMYGSSYIPTNTSVPIPNMTDLDSIMYSSFLEIIDVLTTTQIIANARILSTELAAQNAYQSVEIAGSCYLTGSNISKYDGNAVTPAQARLYPQFNTITAKVGVAILVLTGVYSFVCIGVKLDAQGNITKTATSEPISITLAGAQNNVDITFKNILIADFDRIFVYRTTNAGTVYYFDGIADGVSVTFSPLYTDALIIANETVYTDADELLNIAPPPTFALIVFKDRLFAITDDKIRYSKKSFKGKPPEFAEELFIDIETQGGDPTGGAVLGDKFLIFKTNRVYYVAGDGPNDQGQGGAFSAPQLISDSVGAVNQSTILSLGTEVWFQSTKGYYKIDLSLSITEVGLEINYFLTSTPVNAINYVKEENEVRISDGTRTYVHNLYTRQWGIFEWADSDQKAIGEDFYKITQVAAVNVIAREDPDLFQDLSGEYTLRLTTGWLTPDMIQGLQRFYNLIILARIKNTDQNDDQTMRVDIFYDYNPEIEYTYTLNTNIKRIIRYPDSNLYLNNSFSDANNESPFQFKVGFPRQKCQAVRVQISDVPTGTGKDTFEIVALGLEFGVKKNVATLKSTLTA